MGPHWPGTTFYFVLVWFSFSPPLSYVKIQPLVTGKSKNGVNRNWLYQWQGFQYEQWPPASQIQMSPRSWKHGCISGVQGSTELACVQVSNYVKNTLIHTNLIYQIRNLNFPHLYHHLFWATCSLIRSWLPLKFASVLWATFRPQKPPELADSQTGELETHMKGQDSHPTFNPRSSCSCFPLWFYH